jgi:hypothetical protein
MKPLMKNLFATYTPVKGGVPIGQLEDGSTAITTLRHEAREDEWYFQMQHHGEAKNSPTLAQVEGRHYPWTETMFRRNNHPATVYEGDLQNFYGYIEFGHNEIERHCERGALSTAHIEQILPSGKDIASFELPLRLCLRQLQELKATNIVTMSLTQDCLANLKEWDELLLKVGFQYARPSPFQNFYVHFSGIFDGYKIRG